ncbi:MAG: hypothetical protein HYT47_02780 [Candidatus Vogelbacteria bacterium]|nr:hypothetical protein [Candidatus Vogelbacteria bacterium]
MKARTRGTVLALFGAALVLVGGFWGGLEYGRQNKTAPSSGRFSFTLDDAAARQLLSESGSWYALRELPTDEMKLHSLALAKSRSCPECSNTWEAWGSQDYYSVPVVSTFSDESGDEVYELVTGTAFHVNGRPTTYEPRMVIYYATRGGYAARIDENDQVWRRTGKNQWVLIDDQNFASLVRQKVKCAVWDRNGT